MILKIRKKLFTYRFTNEVKAFYFVSFGFVNELWVVLLILKKYYFNSEEQETQITVEIDETTTIPTTATMVVLKKIIKI